ncbi:serine hydrolase [Paenibacillus eucommiae]|uniref:CubicO group peptidase (Beta-lactamase class C family) n=1 Tax=Paenibacillus eucommiae TaxID=1355755 RepID=A0ABS4J5F9_9BACL|nr:serine hydrolase [Paenibacillus eucommiae]MBP1995074.1 CubicO group peptidase (beta-lactamase class C family) [Paenibacillus eucommiae]
MTTKQQQFQQFFHTLAEKEHIYGAVLVADKGEVIYKAAFGCADLSSGRKLTTNSVFELASLSKPFTAIGVILLEEQGKLQYDDLIERWLPELPYPGITVRHLLCHTSGLPDYMALFFEHWDRSQIATNQDVLQMLIKYHPPVHFQPNDSWLYSNTGYVLLALLIERITGQTFPQYMQENIFQPLGMKDTRVYNRRYRSEQIPDYAYGYVYDVHAGKLELPDLVEETKYVTFLDGIQGDGTVNSTLDDLFKFDRALYTHEFLSKASLEQAFTPARMNNDETFDYGFGWILYNTEEAGREVSHSGGWPGYASTLFRYIDHDQTIIFLRNKEQEVEFEQATIEAIKHILFEQPYVVPERPPLKEALALDPVIYERYVGTYRFESNSDIFANITIEEERLFMQLTGQVRLELHPSAETIFFLRSLPVEVVFTMEHPDKANMLTIIQEGSQEQAQRI